MRQMMQVPGSAIVVHPGRVVPGAEIVDGELVDEAPYQAPDPVFCDSCGHFHRTGSEDHPAMRHQTCGSYLCCQS